MKVCIAGSRSFKDYDLLVKKCDEILQAENTDTLEFVCGLAEGADKLGEQYAKERGCAIRYFPAHWNDLKTEPLVIRTNKYGKKYNAAAGHNRNNQMRDYIKDGGMLIAFWNGISKGTKQMIDACKKYNIKTYIINSKQIQMEGGDNING